MDRINTIKDMFDLSYNLRDHIDTRIYQWKCEDLSLKFNSNRTILTISRLDKSDVKTDSSNAKFILGFRNHAGGRKQTFIRSFEIDFDDETNKVETGKMFNKLEDFLGEFDNFVLGYTRKGGRPSMAKSSSKI